jgi:hypothetical protein
LDVDTTVEAAGVGNVDMLRWCVQSMPVETQQQVDHKVCTAAAKGGHLEALQLLVERYDFLWSTRACSMAAYNGHLHIIKYLRNAHIHAVRLVCPWDSQTCANASANGHLHVLEWCVRQEEPAPMNEKCCRVAASRGQLTSLCWLREECTPPCPWDAYSCNEAASNGYLECLIWLRANGCQWNADSCRYVVARHGHLHVLHYLREQIPDEAWAAGDGGQRWDAHTCYCAATGGHVAILRFLRSESPPCAWDRAAILAAVEGD